MILKKEKKKQRVPTILCNLLRATSTNLYATFLHIDSKFSSVASMASSSQSSRSLIPRTILLVSIVGFLLPSQPQALKSPFSPRDVLPLLPRQVSWPILNYLNSAADILPTFVGAVSSLGNDIQWKGACFNTNTAWLEFHNNSGSEFGGGTLHIKVCVYELALF